MYLKPAAFRIVVAELVHRSFVHPLEDLVCQGKRFLKPLGTGHRAGSSDFSSLDSLMKMAQRVGTRLWVDLVHRLFQGRELDLSSVPVGDSRPHRANPQHPSRRPMGVGYQGCNTGDDGSWRRPRLANITEVEGSGTAMTV